MSKILAIAGSLRRASFNAGLLRAAVAVAPEGVSIEIATIRDIPVYDGDLEAASGIPEPVAALKERIARADGLLIASPEYNQSIPGPLKNAIDWTSRPPKDLARVFSGLPVALLGASPGRLGTAMSQTAWLGVFRALGVVPFFGTQLYVSGAGKLFDANGDLTDDDTKSRLASFIERFCAFVAATPRAR